MSGPLDEWGGYFGLDLPLQGELHRDAMCFQSARAAFLTLLRSWRPRRMWMPAYLCESMMEPLRAAGIDTAYYQVSNEFVPRSLPALGEDEFLVYVNYFGICRRQVAELTQRLGEGKLILDNSQALFERPQGHLATLYSPRKFVGAPDGGYLYVRGRTLDLPTAEDSGAFQRLQGMVLRCACSAREGYQAFVKGEASLIGHEPRLMSRITRRILASYDYHAIACIRRRNFDLVHQELGPLNTLALSVAEDCIPLCYPLVLPFDCTVLKSELHRRGIFVPTYWREARDRLPGGAAERDLIDNTLFVPIDQRLDAAAELWIVGVIRELVNRAAGSRRPLFPGSDAAGPGSGVGVAR